MRRWPGPRCCLTQVTGSRHIVLCCTVCAWVGAMDCATPFQQWPQSVPLRQFGGWLGCAVVSASSSTQQWLLQAAVQSVLLKRNCLSQITKQSPVLNSMLVSPHTQRLHHSYHQPCCSHQTVATLQRRAQQTLQPPHTLLLHEAGDTVAGEAAHQGTAEPGSQADAALQWLSLVHAAVVTCCLAGSAGASVPCKLSTTCSNNSRDTTIAKAGNTTGTFKPACDMHANPARVSLLCTGVCPDPTKSAAMLGASKDSF